MTSSGPARNTRSITRRTLDASHRMLRAAGRALRTLRGRLVLAVVALLAGVSIMVGVASVLTLQGYLMNKLDSQLTQAMHRSSRVIARSPAQGGFGGSLTGNSEFLGLGQTPGTIGAVIHGGEITVASVLEKSVKTRPMSLPQARLLAQVPADAAPRTIDLGGNLGHYRVVASGMPDDSTLLIGLPLSDVTATIGQLVLVIVIVALAGLAIAVVAGLLMVRLALRPLDRVAATAAAVATLPLDQGDVALAVRVPEADTDPHTEVGRVGAALNRMLEHVASAFASRQASENRLRQFVADASHELRTPLASIRGYSELTRRGRHELPDDVSHSLSRIESESMRMTSLVEDLLLLARLDSGRPLERDPVDLSVLLVDAVSDAHAAGPNHVWSLDLPEEPVLVSGDRARLHQVIANLLANARVHTPEGTSVVTALAARPDGATITVTDNGPGIDESVSSTLFERFARADSSRSRATGSTGLGLAIVHAVVSAHGGIVAVDSRPGRTVFSVTLPAPDVP